RNLQIGQVHARVEFDKFLIIPLGDLTHEDIRENFAGKVQRLGDARQVVGWNDGAHDQRNVDDCAFNGGEIFFFHEGIGAADGYAALGHLLDASAGSRRLVVDFHVLVGLGV